MRGKISRDARFMVFGGAIDFYPARSSLFSLNFIFIHAVSAISSSVLVIVVAFTNRNTIYVRNTVSKLWKINLS